MSTSVNRQARKRRHEKALKEIWSLLHHEKRERPQVVQQTSFGLRFKVQVASVTLGAMVLSSFFVPNMGLWTSVEGGFIGFEDDTLAFLEVEGADNIMIASDDGFLEKPMLPTESGDRTTLRDVSTYTVRDGDSISSIAQEFGIDAQTIMDTNGIDNPARIRTGAQLKILPVSGVLHTMNSDASIQAVAEKYNVSKDAIARQNGLAMDAVLAKGTQVIVPGAKIIKAAPVVVAAAPTARASAGGGGGGGGAAVAARPQGGSLGTAAAGRMIWPTKNPLVTQGYKYGHPALDIAYVQGDHTTGIHASMAGKVIMSQGGWNDGYGNVIVIDHGNGLKTRYAHMSALYAKVGQYVAQGEMIGWMGKSGNVYGRTGLHLHFEVILNGQRLNPYQYF